MVPIIKAAAKMINRNVGVAFAALDWAFDCQYDYGLYGIRYYRQAGGLQGGAVVVISQNAANAVLNNIVGCVASFLPTMGGGHGYSVSCPQAFKYTAAPEGVVDTY